MTIRKEIELVTTAFVKAGDNSDVNLLEVVLHKDFRVISSEFMGKPGVTILDKKKYINNIRKGIFGGKPRKMKIEKIDFFETIATVTLRLESAENSFVSYNSLVLDVDDRWKLIHNIAVVKAKNES